MQKNITKMIEWELVTHCNYNCSYCVLPNLVFEKDETKLYNFISSFPDDIEIFCFGGEPYLHTKIKFIIDTFIKLNKKFVIQTNASNFSCEKVKEVKNTITQISIHPTEISIDDAIRNIKIFDEYSTIRKIDIMYSSKIAIQYYIKLHKEFDHLNIEVIPINGFYENKSNDILKEFNIQRDKYSNIVKFEQLMIGNVYRSVLWEKYNSTSIFGNPCLYKDKYFLYSSDLTKYNCCYRKQNDGICQNDKCFLM